MRPTDLLPSRPGSLLAPLGLACLLLTLTAPAAGQDVSPAKIRELKEQIAEIDEWLEDAEEDRSDLEQELLRLDRQVSRLVRERRELNSQIRDKEQELANLQQRQRALTDRLDSQRESLKRQIRSAWMEGDAPALKVLLNEVDPDQIARTMTYYEYLSQDTVQRLEAFNRTLQELQQTRDDLQQTTTRLATLERDVASRQQELQSSKQQRQQTLAKLEGRIDRRQNQRQSLEADRKRLERLLKEVQEAIASIPAPNESAPFSSLRNKLPWPASGRIIKDFGDSLAQGKLRQNGLLIATGGEREVKAVHYGRVVFANWLRGFGLMTIIDHGDGYMTLYGHNSSLLASPGDWVAAGEAIAISGNTGGTDEPAAYFEIRVNGNPTNPKKWLARQ